MVMSGSSLIRLEEVAEAAPTAWFQAYLPGEPDRILALLERVEQAGFGTLMLTVDTAVLANRENNIRSGFSTPLRPGLRLAWDGLIRPGWTLNTFLRTLLRHGMPHFENSYATRGAPILARNVMRDFGAKDHLNWHHLELIRKRWKGRLVVKGIMAREDACIARDSGVDGIVVSNHGGRQLDGTVSPLRVLPAIADAVGTAIPVMMDGGVRRGTDVLKAMALGAVFVFVGRPFVYAAAIAGEAGVQPCHQHPFDRDRPGHGSSRDQLARGTASGSACQAWRCGWRSNLRAGRWSVGSRTRDPGSGDAPIEPRDDVRRNRPEAVADSALRCPAAYPRPQALGLPCCPAVLEHARSEPMPRLTPPPNLDPRTPKLALPAGAVDCHVHMFGPRSKYPFGPDAHYISEDATAEVYFAIQARLGLSMAVLVSGGGYGQTYTHLADTLRRYPDRLRGVVRLPPAVTMPEIVELDRIGVRGRASSARTVSPE